MTLEIKVDSHADGGLKIIDHIPAVRPCRLEGRNGIGKSALIRLLVILGGKQPYSQDPGSWRSLKKLIGPTVITIEGLTGGHSTARVELTPNEWPPEVPNEIGPWLGNLTLDGKEAPVETLFDLFSVVHLSGTERLADTLIEQKGRLGVALAGVNAKLDALSDQRAQLGDLAEQLRFASPAAFEADQSNLQEVVAQRHTLTTQLEAVRPLAEDLQRAHSLRAFVEAGDAAEHAQKLKDLGVKVEEARGRLIAAEAARNTALTALAKGTQVEKEVAQRERKLATLQRNESGLLARQEELAKRIEAVGIAADAETLDNASQEALDAAIDAATRHQRLLYISAARGHRNKTENQLVDDVRVVLDDAINDGLATTIVARVNNVDITVQDLREGLGYLPDINPTGQTELVEANEILAELHEVRSLFERRSKLHGDLEQVRTELSELEPDAAAHDDLRTKAAAAREELEAAAIEVRTYNSQIGAVSRSVIGGGDVTDFEAVIADLLNRHSVDPADLHSAVAEAQSKHVELQGKDTSLADEIERLTANATRRRLVRETLRRNNGAAFSGDFLHHLAATLTPNLNPGSEAEWADETWQRLADHIIATKETFDGLVSNVTGLEAVTDESATKLSASPMGSAVRAVVEAEALLELSSRPIAEALFDGGDVTRVSLDDDSSITWTTPAGVSRTRPMSAFSSGEQALGFMRARLQQVADQPAENRLVFLDEFGAFISADRRRPLAELLASDELKGLSDQIVVILPLQVDYAAAIDETTGDLQKAYKAWAADIADHGYFTEAMQP